MAKLPTLAFVSDAIYPYNKGGKETRLFELTTRFTKRGYNVHIYCMKWWQGNEVRVENGVTLHGICELMPLYDGPRRSIKQGVLFGLACFKLLGAKFDIVDVDHMPFFPLYSMRVVCWLKRKRMIGTWNEVWGKEYWIEYLGVLKGCVATAIERVAVMLPDEILSISPTTTIKLIHNFGIPEAKIISVPCGYNREAISVVKPSKHTSDVIFVGRLLSHKHVDKLLYAVHEIKKTRPKILCRIVGIGPEEKRLHMLQAKLGLQNNVFFHGELHEHSEVIALMKSSKVFVLPSTREGFGIVVLEANACGLPVITADDPNNAATLIAQVTSDLEPDVLSRKILELLEVKQLSSEAEKSILENIENFDWTKIQKLYIRDVIK